MRARRAWLGGVLAAATIAMPAVATAVAQHDAAPDGAHAAAQVVIRTTAVDPMRATALTGEQVQWLNVSVREHTVTSADGLFDSDRLRSGRRFAHTFETPGSFAYYCRIHPFIQGSVDVADVLLHGPAGPVVRGDELMLEGRAHPGARTVAIERDSGAGFEPVATLAAADDGAFRTRLTAEQPATYRAVVGSDVSPAVTVDVVSARSLQVSATRAGRRLLVRVSVNPALPGGFVHLQRHLKHRFGWWTIRKARLTGAGRATISLPRGFRAPVRVVLRQPDGETAVAVSRIVRLRAR
jgi:plastocyanin